MHWTVTVIPEAEAELLALPTDMQTPRKAIETAQARLRSLNDD